MLKPFFAQPNAPINANAHADVLRTDLLPRIATVFPEGKKWHSQHDMASAHSCGDEGLLD